MTIIAKVMRPCDGMRLDDVRLLFRAAYSVARSEWRFGPAGAHGLLLCLSMPHGAAAARVMQSRARA